MFRKYVGRTGEIIYMDQSGNFSERVVDVRNGKNGRAHVYCHKAQAPRFLNLVNIIAVGQIKEGA
ncbi:hypothetical protein [Paenibacillus daejeonensis]|uniref:hypothetical protein n=1 Tax=Paenibacillus daejeonensis TaxID=135193 RepID=UPI0003661331|nr:hypothetical protein [Paenibacillus daejeonensis]